MGGEMLGQIANGQNVTYTELKNGVHLKRVNCGFLQLRFDYNQQKSLTTHHGSISIRLNGFIIKCIPTLQFPAFEF